MLILFVWCSTSYAQHKCGNDYFTSTKRLEKLKPTFTALAFQPGDTIASIGASNGWFEAALSVYQDNLTFYLEDIDTNCLNKTNLNAELALYSSLKHSPIKNKFFLHTGTETSTGLPKNTFKKVLLNDVYHHFTNKPQMLSELQRICRASAELLLMEPIGPSTKKCAYYQEPEKLIREIESAGFSFLNQTEVMEGTFLFRFSKR